MQPWQGVGDTMLSSYGISQSVMSQLGHLWQPWPKGRGDAEAEPEFCLFVWDLRRESSCAKMSSLEVITFPVVVASSRQRFNLGRNKSRTGEFTFRGKIELGRLLPILLLLSVKIYRRDWGTFISKSVLWLSVFNAKNRRLIIYQPLTEMGGRGLQAISKNLLETALNERLKKMTQVKVSVLILNQIFCLL